MFFYFQKSMILPTLFYINILPPLHHHHLTLCHDPPPSPSLISTSLRVYERLTSLTGGVHDDG